MDYTISEVLSFVEENNVKFIKFSFCDCFGNLKNISVLSDVLNSAFESGIAFNSKDIKGFDTLKFNRLFLKPDPKTLTVLPWRPQEGCVARLYCDIIDENGSIVSCDTRNILIEANNALKSKGINASFSTDCEFYLFNVNELGEPTLTPADVAGYLDVAPLDKGENVRRDICLTLEEMGIIPQTSHHEKGPGQNEIDFFGADVLTAADNFTTFKSVINSISARNGLFASFMPMPITNEDPSGLHISVSLKNCSDEESNCFVAGILNRAKEIALITNPIINSYERLEKNSDLKVISISNAYNSMLKISKDKSTFKFCSPDPACNHYLVFALMIYAGIEGIENKLTFENISKDNLPNTLDEAIILAQNSEFLNKHLSKELITAFVNSKHEEIDKYNNPQTKQKYIDDTFLHT